MRGDALRFLWLLALVMAGRTCPGEPVQRDWPGWRGPDGNSITAESGWRPEALLPTPGILWRVNVGNGYSSVCIQGPHLFTMGSSNATDSVYCLQVDTGREVWRHSYPCKPGPYVGTRATPLFVDGLVYTVSRGGDVFCLRSEDGAVCWHRNLVREANARVPIWGIASSAVRDGDTILVNAARYGVALDRKTGEILWQSPEDKCGYASPVLYDAEGRHCMVAFGRNAAHGVAVKTGELLWTKPWVTRLEENSADHVVQGDLVFISSIYSKGCTVFSVTGNKPKEVWVNRSLQNKFGTSVLFGGHLYGVHGLTARR